MDSDASFPLSKRNREGCAPKSEPLLPAPALTTLTPFLPLSHPTLCLLEQAKGGG